jgi:hypothetical protein
MGRENPESLFINGMLVEIIQSGGRRNFILTLRADYELSQYDFVQCLIGIVTAKKFLNPSYLAHPEDIDQVREKVGDIFYQIRKDLATESMIANSINDLFGICLQTMFPVVVLDGRVVREVHPLIWGFLKQWNLLISSNIDEQRTVLINLLKIMESDRSVFGLSLSEEIEFLRKLGLTDKRALLRSILKLKGIIMAYKKINNIFSRMECS